jgi:hypothetical protein
VIVFELSHTDVQNDYDLSPINLRTAVVFIGFLAISGVPHSVDDRNARHTGQGLTWANLQSDCDCNYYRAKRRSGPIVLIARSDKII